jgi:hypothetical protein
MHTGLLTQNIYSSALRNRFSLAATAALLLALAPGARAQNVDFDPAALAKQRSGLILKATHAPIADLENDLNHLAVLSETCRTESGAKACGLSDKPLESGKLEDRYAYYVRTPMEAHATKQPAKIDRHNWEAPAAASQ